MCDKPLKEPCDDARSEIIIFRVEEGAGEPYPPAKNGPWISQHPFSLRHECTTNQPSACLQYSRARGARRAPSDQAGITSPPGPRHASRGRLRMQRHRPSEHACPLAGQLSSADFPACQRSAASRLFVSRSSPCGALLLPRRRPSILAPVACAFAAAQPALLSAVRLLQRQSPDHERCCRLVLPP